MEGLLVIILILGFLEVSIKLDQGKLYSFYCFYMVLCGFIYFIKVKYICLKERNVFNLRSILVQFGFFKQFG